MMRAGKYMEKSHEVGYDDVCHETVKQEEAKKEGELTIRIWPCCIADAGKNNTPKQKNKCSP